MHLRAVSSQTTWKHHREQQIHSSSPDLILLWRPLALTLQPLPWASRDGLLLVTAWVGLMQRPGGLLQQVQAPLSLPITQPTPKPHAGQHLSPPSRMPIGTSTHSRHDPTFQGGVRLPGGFGQWDCIGRCSCTLIVPGSIANKQCLNLQA